METVDLPVLAAALSCKPRTLCRLIHGPFAARSLQRAPVSLGLAAQALNVEQQALSLFLKAAIEKTDEALNLDFALMVTGMPERTFLRHVKEGRIPTVVRLGRSPRFSRNVLANLNIA